MNPILVGLLKRFLKTALMVMGALAVEWLVFTVTNFHPADPQAAILWNAAILPLLTGLLHALRRWHKWDPAKVGK